jgi:hypothetical protein
MFEPHGNSGEGDPGLQCGANAGLIHSHALSKFTGMRIHVESTSALAMGTRGQTRTLGA